jgi:nucleoside 2-deoxyribosyltransferase
MAEKEISVILFGPLFTLAERDFNFALAEAIMRQSQHSVVVTLPQEEAKKHVICGVVDCEGIKDECLKNAVSHDVAVAILDGADADSGTCIEIGFRKGRDSKLVVIGVRTDFRASEDGRLNAMLRLCDEIIYDPSTETSIERLAEKVVEAIGRHYRK